MGAARIKFPEVRIFQYPTRSPVALTTGITSFGPKSNIGEAIGCAEVYFGVGAWLRPWSWHVMPCHNTDGSRRAGGARRGGGGRSRQRQRSEPRGMPRALSTDTLQHSDTHSYRDRPRSRSE